MFYFCEINLAKYASINYSHNYNTLLSSSYTIIKLPDIVQLKQLSGINR